MSIAIEYRAVDGGSPQIGATVSIGDYPKQVRLVAFDSADATAHINIEALGGYTHVSVTVDHLEQIGSAMLAVVAEYRKRRQSNECPHEHGLESKHCTRCEDEGLGRWRRDEVTT